MGKINFKIILFYLLLLTFNIYANEDRELLDESLTFFKENRELFSDNPHYSEAFNMIDKIINDPEIEKVDITHPKKRPIKR